MWTGAQEFIWARSRYVVQTPCPTETPPDWDQVTIDILSNDILLCIFYEYANGPYKGEEWRTLVHVCRRWRTLVFGSPRHLNLQLFCWIGTQVTKKLDIWPTFPIVVCHRFCQDCKMPVDNLIAAIKHNDRVCEVDFHTFRVWDKSQMEEVVSAMQVSFPALTDLTLCLTDDFETVMVIPNSFLGGSAPCLRRLHLEGMSFPGLPKLLLSTTSLVSLELCLPHYWYISPDTMVACLSALARLKLFILEFESPQPRQDRRRHLPPPTRTLLPALTFLGFKGVDEYAEDLMTRIDVPLLHSLHITFLNEIIRNVPQLSQFINRTPTFQAFDDARVAIFDDQSTITLPLPIRTTGCESEALVLGISLEEETVEQLSSLTHLCRSLLPTIAKVEHLDIDGEGSLIPLDWSDEGARRSDWLELLRLFTGAKNLHLSKDIAPCISSYLREVAEERMTDVLPALKNLSACLYGFQREGPDSVGEDLKCFVAARQLGYTLLLYVLQ